jgi:hypothetical protein
MCAPVVHPDVARLRARCIELRGQLRSAAEEWHRLSTKERPRLSSIYDLYFGDMEREYQRLALDDAELFRRIELLSIKVARGEVLTPEMIDYVNRVVDKEYERYRQRIREAFDMNGVEREEAARQRGNAPSDDELVKMYRTLVKRLHPDAVGEQPDLEPMWQRVQDAYAERNVSQLRSILAMLEADIVDDASMDGWDVARLQREIDTLSSRLRVEERKLARLRATEPLSIGDKIEDGEWRAMHKRMLEDRMNEKRKEYDDHRARYREITGGDVVPGTDPTRSDEDRQRDEDFMQNTYFGQR